MNEQIQEINKAIRLQISDLTLKRDALNLSVEYMDMNNKDEAYNDAIEMIGQLNQAINSLNRAIQ